MMIQGLPLFPSIDASTIPTTSTPSEPIPKTSVILVR